jgi:hypothetical protein
VRLLESEGLETFTDDGIETLFAAVADANFQANFTGLGSDEAVRKALATAEQDSAVQRALEEGRIIACEGDCDGAGTVTVDEVVKCVGLALGGVSAQPCAACDKDVSGTVTVDEIITAVNHALTGCAA